MEENNQRETAKKHYRFGSAVAAAVMALGSVFASSASAQDYPTRPIVLVTTSAAGGAQDLMSRPVTEYLRDSLNTPVIVDNRPGGNTIVGATHVARAAPDGYTLLMASLSTHVLNPITRTDLPYDPDKDFTPVVLFTSAPYVLSVSSRLDVDSLAEFVELVKERPGEIKYGASVGSPGHFAALQMADVADLEITHVPYGSVADAAMGILTGDIDFSFGPLSAVTSMVEQGQIKVLAAGSRERMTQLPETPTLIESGYEGFETGAWYGIVAPAGSPEPALDLLNAEINKALQDPEVISRLDALGYIVEGGTRESFQEMIVNQREVISRIAEGVDLQVQ